MSTTQKKSPALHEILAVEADAQGVANRIIPETIHTFKEKSTHFTASFRSLELFGEETDASKAAELAEAQELQMVSTVHDKLQYTLDQIGRYYDIVLQKETTNQHAVADVIAPDGTVIAEDLPATFLLGLETKLKTLRTVYEAIPTLAPGIEWQLDATQGKNVYRQKNPEVRAKTAKTFKHQVLVAPTDKHPAQIEKWEESITIGTYTKKSWSSMLTTSEKSDLLGRIDVLIQAVKQARQRANSVEVKQVTVAQSLFDFIHPNGF